MDILAISKSGESDELIGLLPTIRRIGARRELIKSRPFLLQNVIGLR